MEVPEVPEVTSNMDISNQIYCLYLYQTVYICLYIFLYFKDKQRIVFTIVLVKFKEQNSNFLIAKTNNFTERN